MDIRRLVVVKDTVNFEGMPAVESGGLNVKATEKAIEYPPEDINPDDVPF